MNKWLVIFYLFASFTLFSQEAIDAAFVSRLTTVLSNEKILIKWENPENFSDYITIYRSNMVIDTKSKLSDADRLVILKNQEEKYIDTPNYDGQYYYAVIITNKSNQEDYAIFVPYRNYTTTPITLYVKTGEKVVEFKAESNDTYINLTWKYYLNEPPQKKVMIYRHTSIIDSDNMLTNSIKIISLDGTIQSYVDVPIPNIDYYYAIFIENTDKKTYEPNIDITDYPVSIKSRNLLFPSFSVDNFIPLPLLTIKNDPTSGKYFLDPQILKNPTKIHYTDSVRDIINQNRKEYLEIYSDFIKKQQKSFELLKFHLLDDEEIYVPREYNNEYKSAINYIRENSYKPALTILEELFKEILPEDLLFHVSFYLGMIYYQNQNYYQSYIYLNKCYSAYTSEVLPYLNSIYLHIFDKLEINELN